MSDDESRAEFAHPEYWNDRYNAEFAQANNANHDWARSFESIRPFLMNHLPPARSGNSILHLGCGNSTLTADLHGLNYTNQTSIDFSPVLINQMSSRHPTLIWQVMDVRDMSFPEASFDIAIDKATLDAMLYGSSWEPEEEVKRNVRKYVDEVARVLKPGGLWLYITWKQPQFITPLLQRPAVWTLESEILQDPYHDGGRSHYYGYVMRKVAS